MINWQRKRQEIKLDFVARWLVGGIWFSNTHSTTHSMFLYAMELLVELLEVIQTQMKMNKSISVVPPGFFQMSIWSYILMTLMLDFLQIKTSFWMELLRIGSRNDLCLVQNIFNDTELCSNRCVKARFRNMLWLAKNQSSICTIIHIYVQWTPDFYDMSDMQESKSGV